MRVFSRLNPPYEIRRTGLYHLIVSMMMLPFIIDYSLDSDPSVIFAGIGGLICLFNFLVWLYSIWFARKLERSTKGWGEG